MWVLLCVAMCMGWCHEGGVDGRPSEQPLLMECNLNSSYQVMVHLSPWTKWPCVLASIGSGSDPNITTGCGV